MQNTKIIIISASELMHKPVAKSFKKDGSVVETKSFEFFFYKDANKILFFRLINL